MTKALEYLYVFLVFPGFLFSGTMGLVVGWIDRKLTARLQWRVGPPWYQNFLDIIKLSLFKETLIPRGVSRIIFLGMPMVALSSATLVSMMLFLANGAPAKSSVGDVIALVYLMIIPALALMLGAFASGNTLASLGGSREMKLMLSYELPFILSLAVPIIKAGGAIRLGDILIYQSIKSPVICSISGAISFLVMLLCMQAKAGLTPFDISEAETEIMSGTHIEYSGKALAMLKLARAILFFVMPVLLITLYLGGIKYSIKGFAKNLAEYFLIIFLMVVIKNTNPRVRIDQAMGFFWRPVTFIAILAVVLAYFGI